MVSLVSIRYRKSLRSDRVGELTILSLSFVNRIESLNINWEIEAGQWITWKPKFSPNFPDFSFSD